MDSNNKDTSSKLASNPFLALFQTNVQHGGNITSDEPVSVCFKESQSEETLSSTAINGPASETIPSLDLQNDEGIINDILQRVFLVTISNDSERRANKHVGSLPRRCVFLKDTSNDADSSLLLSWHNIDQALMERLTMSNPRNNVIVTGGAHSTSLTADLEARESTNIKYLHACYRRAYDDYIKFKEKKPELCPVVEKARNLAVSYAGTCLLSSDLFPSQDSHKQLFELFSSLQGNRTFPAFVQDLLQQYSTKKEVESIFSPIFFMLNEKKDEIMLFGHETFQHFDLLTFFSNHSELAELIVSCNCWFPPSQASFLGHQGSPSGRAFQTQTLIGPYLALSSVSPNRNKPSEYFLQPSQQTQADMQATMANLRTQLDSLSNKLYMFFFNMLKASKNCKHEILQWFGSCLHSNMPRQRMMSELFARTLADDGFFLNLGSVLLKLCQPFLDPSCPKLLRIDPRYCATVTNLDMLSNEAAGMHSVGLEEETRLVMSGDENLKLKQTEKFGFVTELFFITHRCLQLGVWKICEKYRKLMNDLAQMQRTYQDASSQQGGESAMISTLKATFEKGIIQQLCLKTHLLNPTSFDLVMRFYIATASWLNQVALAGDDFQDMKEFKELQMPLPGQTPAGLLFIPEFLVENMADFVIFLRHFSEETLENSGKGLHHLLTFFVIFMGSPERVKNPHLRAKLAEALEAIVPVRKSQETEMERSPLAMFHRQQAFSDHKEAIEHLPVALIRLFIDIEFTGHSMQFEQKFGYRHHMYTVLEYIWSQENYRATLITLCNSQMDMKKKEGEPPLILKFINLLINDAVFLLDEALEFMAQIKKMQSRQDNGEIEGLAEQEREEFHREVRQTSQMAKSHNILANETVHTLNYLTTELKRPFIIPCMANRIASMLNYFLLNLVGPKMGSFKVKDFSEFHFKPQQLVSDIVDIYLNLGDEPVFLESVSRDERSYSKSLFEHAERVLKLIGRPATVIFKLSELARKVESMAAIAKIDESELPEPPDEFKDPIMDTLMRNPMILPTSGKIVDRDIICRHLLSDQKDPFNRKPLNICDLRLDEALKARIDEWLFEHSRHTDKDKELSAADDRCCNTKDED